MRILIADDEPAILMSLDFLMRKEGHQVYVARDGEEAIQLIEKELPEVIILDIMMPKIDGYGVCSFLFLPKLLIQTLNEATRQELIYMYQNLFPIEIY
jgi:CheY-like chemotaxis protein